MERFKNFRDELPESYKDIIVVDAYNNYNIEFRGVFGMDKHSDCYVDDEFFSDILNGNYVWMYLQDFETLYNDFLIKLL